MAAASTTKPKPQAAKRTTTPRKPRTPKAPVAPTPVVEEVVVQPEPVVQNKPIVAKAYEPHQTVMVRNGFQGKLVYKSKKTGEAWAWDEFGDEQEMEISELRSAKSSAKFYFSNNWFMFDDPEIVDHLGVSQFYKFAIGIKDFDRFFEKGADEIKEHIPKLSEGQKKSVAYRARRMIADGSIDSNKVIAVLEECLGVELIER